jgi:hypothetical protein
MENLDLKCAELGQRLAQQQDVKEKLLTDALSVLEEQGVYALFLYLRARAGTPGEAVCKASVTFLRETPAASPLLANGDVWQALHQLGEDLDKLLFARDLLRQALVYGRYHAKVRENA